MNRLSITWKIRFLHPYITVQLFRLRVLMYMIDEALYTKSLYRYYITLRCSYVGRITTK